MNLENDQTIAINSDTTSVVTQINGSVDDQGQLILSEVNGKIDDLSLDIEALNKCIKP